MRHDVMGDGSCMYYAVLKGAGFCDHECPLTLPTKADRGRDALLRVRAYTYVTCFCMGQLNSDDLSHVSGMLIMPRYPIRKPDDMGVFGTNVSLYGIAGYLQSSIVVWNASTCTIDGAKQQVVRFESSTQTKVCEQYLTMREILRLTATTNLIHIEWNGEEEHYRGLVGQRVPSIGPFARHELRTAMPIGTKSKKKKRSSVPASH